MDFLASLDAPLFRFINQSLTNPVFDRLMPWLSGNVIFFPLLLVVAFLLIWKYRRRGALCLVMLALIIPLGDSFVITTLKKAIQRPRPFVTFPETIKRDKASPYASMPSAHAANWFAATMILGLYFRRSVRFTLPVAVAVSLSRVYNGVHYPLDVLAGAILGAGYGFVGVYTLQSVWRLVGRKYFPLWYEQLPTLLPPVKAEATARPKTVATKAMKDAHWFRAGCLLVILLTVARWLYLSSGTIELSEDEAYQWHWSKHLALSYYSKPPMIAYTQFAGTSLWGDNTFGVRFFSPFIAGLLGLMLLRFFTREVSGKTGFFAVLIINAAPLPAVGGMLMTVDPLSVLFWTAAMMAGWKAIRPESGVREWFWVGLWMGLGFLSKYTGLFQLLCWAIFFALWKPARIHLRRPGPWVALLVNVLCFIPVIIWNQQHHWITATHVASNAGIGKKWTLPDALDNFFEFLGVEALLLNPFFFVAALWAAVAFWKRFRNDSRLVYCFCMGTPVFLVYLGWTWHSRVLPNWIAPAILPMLMVAILYWQIVWKEGSRRVLPMLAGGLVFGLIGVTLLCDTDLLRRAFRRPPTAQPDAVDRARTWFDSVDPLNRVRGWSDSAQVVGAVRNELLKDGKPVFIIGAHYGITSLVSFYLPEAQATVATETPMVYCRPSPQPDNQFYFWPGYEQRKGENAIYVSHTRSMKPVPDEVAAQFESITELPLQPITYRGRVLRNLRLFECRNLR